MKIVLLYLTAFAITMFATSSHYFATTPIVVDTVKYQCPMKFEGDKTYDKPGRCPVCKMELKAINQKTVPAYPRPVNNEVKFTGTMMNVMQKGELAGTIDLDTISIKEHLYGLGPVEYLRGELLIIDGRSYSSTVASDGSIKMEETFKIKARFFFMRILTNGKKCLFPTVF